eukprot:TRINITY_DN51463_c0_g2_i1.p1 TRINITY_DN51463_c0_g2~~TRINITY_DN51463_c0_g2_i1.p1  ORF type:complete len:241 (-),score=37.84 TRINITY_DN51463_c0_g2_i1:49-771(-)
MGEAAKEGLRYGAKLQHVVRTTLICALKQWRQKLWLEDSHIEPVLQHIRVFIECFQQSHSDMQAACASKQWRRLAELCSNSATALADCEQNEDVQRRKNLRHNGYNKRVVEKATQAGGVYIPSDLVRALPYVSQRSETVQLHCNKCSGIVQASWYATVKGIDRVILPQNGHPGCKKSRLRPRSDVPTVDDDNHSIVYCPHGLREHRCRQCGGGGICEHNKRRDACPKCRAARAERLSIVG